MAKLNKLALVRAAARARRGAVAPYSRFQVGAALLTRSGQVITGANVESASYGLTCCAERVALFNALTAGQRDFVAVAVVARTAGGPMPCGACRQLLAEYAPRAAVGLPTMVVGRDCAFGQRIAAAASLTPKRRPRPGSARGSS